MQKFWNVKQLNDALLCDLAQCRTESERINVRAIGGREIRETAERFARERKLTPAEVAIAETFGYRGAN